MSNSSPLPPVPVPPHVPAELVIDFDFFAPPGADEDIHLAWKRLQSEAPPICWTPRNGGHWMALRGELIKEIQLDHERFSHREFIVPVDPNRDFVALPLGVDPPEHTKYRRLIAPAFLPKVVNALEARVRQIAVELVEGLAPRGECDFIADFARHLPITVFMEMVNLPMSDREMLLEWAEDVVRNGAIEARRAAQMKMHGYLAGWIEQRRRNPGEDLISKIVHSTVDDRPITESELFSVLALLLFGGLDTVASMMGFIARYLAMHPEHRRELLEHPENHRNAVEELIRRHGVSSTSRYITHDFDFHGVAFKEADMIYLTNMLYGLDERINDEPTKVDFHREDIRLAAFGNGPHTCPGAVLARRELMVFVEEWLPRIPEFQIKPGTKPLLIPGYVNGVERLELVWDPATTRSI